METSAAGGLFFQRSGGVFSIEAPTWLFQSLINDVCKRTPYCKQIFWLGNNAGFVKGKEKREERKACLSFSTTRRLFSIFLSKDLSFIKRRRLHTIALLSANLSVNIYCNHGSSIRRSRNDRGQGAFPSTLFNICVVNCFIFSAQSQIFAIPTSNYHHIITRVKMPVSHHSSVQSQLPT